MIMINNQTQNNIPTGWQQVKLGDFVDIRSGDSPSMFNFIDSGIYPFYKVEDMNYSEKYITTSRYHFNEYQKPLMEKKMVIFPKRGAAIFTNKVRILSKEAFFDTNIMGLLVKKGLDGEFLYYLLKRIGLSQFADTTSVAQINNKHIIPLCINLPPLPEQNRIVSVLETWDKATEKLNKKIAIKKQIKKGLMQDLLTGKKRLSGFGDKWEVILLRDACKISTGKKDVNEGNPLGVYPFFTCAKNHTYSDNYSFDTEAILIAGNGDVGNCQYYKGKFEAYQRTYVITDIKKDVQYVFAYLGYFFQDTINSQKQMGAMPYIKLGMLQDYKIRIPKSKEEQSAIARILTTADKEITGLENKLSIIKDQKRYLVNNLITGVIRTPENFKIINN
jgi:type I restriction enzyme, S subunit